MSARLHPSSFAMEVVMTSKLVSVSLFAAVSAAVLAGVGCSSNAGNKPYNLTGEQSVTADQQRWIDQHSIDQKGHWNPQLAASAQNDVRVANERAQ